MTLSKKTIFYNKPKFGKSIDFVLNCGGGHLVNKFLKKSRVNLTL